MDVVWTGVEVRSGVVDVWAGVVVWVGVVVVVTVGVLGWGDDAGCWAGMSLEKGVDRKRGHYEQNLVAGVIQRSRQAGSRETCCFRFPVGQQAFDGGQR